MKHEQSKYGQENYVIKKLKLVRSKLYQAYLVPFGVDFTFRIGAVFLASFVGAKWATIIGLSVLTLTRIKALKDLFDVIKGLVETEKLHDPTLTMSKMLTRDSKTILSKSKGKDSSQANSLLILIGALVPMLFDYISMGIAAKYGIAGAAITQIVDTLLHLSALAILYASVKKINETLHKFNVEYYAQFKSFVNDSLIPTKANLFSRITRLFKKISLRDVLDKEKTNQNPERIRRFLVSRKKAETIIKKAINVEQWEQFYLQFSNDKDFAERSIRKQGDKYIVVTKIVGSDEVIDELGSQDVSKDTYTVEITKKRYEEFLKLNGDAPIYRFACYAIPADNSEKIILLDVYEDKFDGLSIARAKFDNSEESTNFIIPEWFEKEITKDPMYTGKHFSWGEKEI